MNLATAFNEVAQRSLQKPALFWGDEEFSYEQFLKQSHWIGERLKQSGVKPGAHVALWLKNCPQFVPALIGVWQAGAVVAPINNFLKPDEVTYILSGAGISVVITDATMSEGSAKLKEARPQLQ